MIPQRAWSQQFYRRRVGTAIFVEPGQHSKKSSPTLIWPRWVRASTFGSARIPFNVHILTHDIDEFFSPRVLMTAQWVNRVMSRRIEGPPWTSRKRG
jgi:hypothetical protein